MSNDVRVEEWTEEQRDEHKSKFSLSEPKQFAVVEGHVYELVSDYMVIGFFDTRAEADTLVVTLEREEMIEASFLAWVRHAKEAYVSDYDEIRKIVRGAL